MTRPGLRANAAKLVLKIKTDYPTADVIYDIGGNVGLMAVAFSLAYPEAIVHTFEPHPLTYQMLCNHVKNLPIAAHNIAMWSRPETLTLAFPPDRADQDNTGLFSAVIRDGKRMVKVEATTVDLFARTHPAPDLIKIDVEGAECEVLAGTRNTLKDAKCLVTEENPRYPHALADVFLEMMGYQKIPAGEDAVWVKHE